MNFIILVKLTHQGIEHIKDSPGRVEQAKKLFQQFGAKVKDFYLVMGEYDSVLIVEANNSETIAKCNLALGSLGNIRTETLCAFDEGEFQKICSKIP